MILLDTNIILRSKQASSASYTEVTEKLVELVTSGEELAVCPQVLYEFYVVATRPVESNGFGLVSKDAVGEINNIIETYTLLDENESVLSIWKRLIEDFNVLGKTAHDTRLVALMKAHNVAKLYTLNRKDFVRFNAIIELI